MKADIRYIPVALQTKITIDRKSSVAIELKDDTTSYEAMGLATFSNSASIVSSNF
jgi:hypothetical protein